jgi:hypothetical protein
MTKSKKASARSTVAGVAGFREAKPAQLRAHVLGVRTKVLPKIKEQMKRKEAGAERAKAFKVF